MYVWDIKWRYIKVILSLLFFEQIFCLRFCIKALVFILYEKTGNTLDIF